MTTRKLAAPDRSCGNGPWATARAALLARALTFATAFAGCGGESESYPPPRGSGVDEAQLDSCARLCDEQEEQECEGAGDAPTCAQICEAFLVTLPADCRIAQKKSWDCQVAQKDVCDASGCEPEVTAADACRDAAAPPAPRTARGHR